MNNKGQAIIEYILLLVVVVSLILFTFAKILNPFKDYFISVGDYVQCLLDYGELPDFGSDSGKAKSGETADGKSCTAKFKIGDASLSASSSNSSSKGSTGNDSTSSSSSSAKNSSKNKSSESNSKSSSSGSSSNTSSTGGAFGSLSQRKIKTAKAGSDREKQELVVDDQLGSSDRSNMSGNYRSRLKRK